MEHISDARMVRDRAELGRIVSLVLDLVQPNTWGLRYRLVGTGAALAQGVALPTGDVDILVAQRADVDRMAAALAGYPCLDPVAWVAKAQQYYAHYAVDGIKVGFSTVEWPAEADTIECAGRGPWQHYVDVPLGDHTVPAVALELRLGSEFVRDRPDRYLPLIEHMRSHGADLDLLHRVITDRGIDPTQVSQLWTAGGRFRGPGVHS